MRGQTYHSPTVSFKKSGISAPRHVKINFSIFLLFLFLHEFRYQKSLSNSYLNLDFTDFCQILHIMMSKIDINIVAREITMTSVILFKVQNFH